MIVPFSTNQFRLAESEPFTRSNGNAVRRFILEQHCPKAEKFVEMLIPGQWHLSFEGQGSQAPTDTEIVIPDKFTKRIKEIVDEKWIMVVSEHHGERYFDATSTEAIGLACLKLIKYRKDNGYYSAPKEPEQPKYKPEDIADDHSLTKVVKRQWETYEDALEQYESDKEFDENLNKALDTKDYVLALQVLKDHYDYEDEGFRFEQLETV